MLLVPWGPRMAGGVLRLERAAICREGQFPRRASWDGGLTSHHATTASQRQTCTGFPAQPGTGFDVWTCPARSLPPSSSRAVAGDGRFRERAQGARVSQHAARFRPHGGNAVGPPRFGCDRSSCGPVTSRSGRKRNARSPESPRTRLAALPYLRTEGIITVSFGVAWP